LWWSKWCANKFRAINRDNGNWVYLATAQAIDQEMQDRIDRHQKDRGDFFTTVEEPRYLVQALQNLVRICYAA
jgi:adenosyl cobinamide kinase/adenosyl cobinamide phosphate guanylyltransferase